MEKYFELVENIQLGIVLMVLRFCILNQIIPIRIFLSLKYLYKNII